MTIAIAERYIANIRARNLDDLLTLFAEDATFITPDNREFVGHDAIRGMYAHLYALDLPLPSLAASVVGAREVANEIVATLPDGSTRHTANFFHLNDAGKIQRLSTYRRG